MKLPSGYTIQRSKYHPLTGEHMPHYALAFRGEGLSIHAANSAAVRAMFDHIAKRRAERLAELANDL